jgi:hypothetical protein
MPYEARAYQRVITLQREVFSPHQFVAMSVFAGVRCWFELFFFFFFFFSWEKSAGNGLLTVSSLTRFPLLLRILFLD